MIYADTSVIVPLFAREAATPRVKAWFAALNEPLVGSDWLIPEFASAIALKVRTRQLSPDQALAIHQLFDEFLEGGLRVLPVSRSAYALAASWVKAHEQGLRAGDALHLAVAQEAGAAVAALDELLNANARRLGIPLATL
jgi:predicted nucleic acid-binding protein